MYIKETSRGMTTILKEKKEREIVKRIGDERGRKVETGEQTCICIEDLSKVIKTQ